MAMKTLSIHENPAVSGLASEVREQLILFREEAWDRYNNPFEQKWVLKHESYTHHMRSFVDWLNAYVIDLPADIEIDYSGHYTAFFKYDIGDYLDLHMDAGVHPLNGKRKAWTLLYYLSSDDVEGGMLEFWSNIDNTLLGWKIGDFVEPRMGTTVLFKNIDNEFHGNPTCVEAGVRLVATVSFLCDSHEGFSNMRERAYFIPRPGLREWGPELYRLRDLRCDPEHYREVYLRGKNASS